MRELTAELPKPMIEVRGKPVLLHIVEGLRACRRYELPDHRRLSRRSGPRLFWRRHLLRLGNQIRHPGCPGWHRSRRRAGTRFRRAIAFLLSYGDILVDRGKLQIAGGTPGRCREAIVSVKQNEDVSKGGAVFVNEQIEVTDLREKPKPGEADQSVVQRRNLRISAEHF